tara:strand:+ start:44 stop:469 length:426 start_codon:yes stop_codon:yes gene_type:complete
VSHETCDTIPTVTKTEKVEMDNKLKEQLEIEAAIHDYAMFDEMAKRAETGKKKAKAKLVKMLPDGLKKQFDDYVFVMTAESKTTFDFLGALADKYGETKGSYNADKTLKTDRFEMLFGIYDPEVTEKYVKETPYYKIAIKK